jgi:hypothetical protein
MAHTITMEELDGWLAQDERIMAACSFGKGSAKKLEVTASTRMFVVTDHDIEKYIGKDKEAAIAAYNRAP